MSGAAQAASLHLFSTALLALGCCRCGRTGLTCTDHCEGIRGLRKQYIEVTEGSKLVILSYQYREGLSRGVPRA